MFTIHYKRYNSLDENVYLYLAIQIDSNFSFSSFQFQVIEYLNFSSSYSKKK